MLLNRKSSDSSITCPWDPVLSHSTFILRTAQGSLPQDLWSVFSKSNDTYTHVHKYMNTHTHTYTRTYTCTHIHMHKMDIIPQSWLYVSKEFMAVLSLILANSFSPFGERTWPVDLSILSTKYNALHTIGTNKCSPCDWYFGKYFVSFSGYISYLFYSTLISTENGTQGFQDPKYLLQRR